ncbi:hypothetical protein NAL12_06115 [Corynebacterium belfantii]|nr:hypothetical protein [Corynebacterium belfantii]
MDCSITAPIVGTTTRSSTFDAHIDVPETVQAGVGFEASVQLNNISVQSEQLSKISGASLKTSTIRIKVGNNVQLDGTQPGVSLTNGVLSIKNKLNGNASTSPPSQSRFASKPSPKAASPSHLTAQCL